MDILCTLVITSFLSAPVRENLRELLFSVMHPLSAACTRCGPTPMWTLLHRFPVSPLVWSPNIVFRWNSPVDPGRAQARSGTRPHDRERFQEIVILGCA